MKASRMMLSTDSGQSQNTRASDSPRLRSRRNQTMQVISTSAGTAVPATPT